MGTVRRFRRRHRSSPPPPIWYIAPAMIIGETPASQLRSFCLGVRRDLRLALRQGGDAAMIVGFFVLAVLLFPFGFGPAPEFLARIGSATLWRLPPPPSPLSR